MSVHLLVVSFFIMFTIAHAGTPYTLTQANKDALVNVHNEARANVQPPAATPLPPLTWSETLATSAAAAIRSCVFAHSGSRYGENLAGATPNYYPAIGWEAVAIKQWTIEVRHYNLSQNSCSGVCGHYTQVVWANSLSVGCARIDGCAAFPQSIINCQYDPPGNYVGQRPYVAKTDGGGTLPSTSSSPRVPSASSSVSPRVPSTTSSSSPRVPSTTSSSSPRVPSTSSSSSPRAPSPSPSSSPIAPSPSTTSTSTSSSSLSLSSSQSSSNSQSVSSTQTSTCSSSTILSSSGTQSSSATQTSSFAPCPQITCRNNCATEYRKCKKSCINS